MKERRQPPAAPLGYIDRMRAQILLNRFPAANVGYTR